MLYYIFAIIILFVCSNLRLNQKQTIAISFFLMLFLCFGYMTGSDWRSYEKYYEEGFTFKLVEPGYVLLSNLFAESGVNFWLFHILFKCISFILTITFISKLSEKNNIFFAVMLWMASFGLYLYIDCPFRNLIAIGLSMVAFVFLLKKKYVYYYLLSLLAITFHFSAIILLLLPIIRLEKFSSGSLLATYFIVMAVLGFLGTNGIFSLISRFLPDIISQKVTYYEGAAEGSILSLGSIPRLVCLFMIIGLRQKLTTSYRYGSIVFNFCYTYLIVSLIYYMIPMLFRSALFLAPFYVFGIVYSLRLIKLSTRLVHKWCWLFLALVITFSVAKSVYFVPYTNILYNCVTGEFYDYNYRYNYNFNKSPFSNGHDDYED